MTDASLREALALLDGAVVDFLSEYDPDGPDDPDGAQGVYDVALWEAHEQARAALTATPAPSPAPAPLDDAERLAQRRQGFLDGIEAARQVAGPNAAIDHLEATARSAATEDTE